MKVKVIARHCDDKPKTIELEVGDKKSFVCEKCHGLFDIDSDGNISDSPMEEGKVVTNRLAYGGVNWSVTNKRIVTKGDVYK